MKKVDASLRYRLGDINVNYDSVILHMYANYYILFHDDNINGYAKVLEVTEDGISVLVNYQITSGRFDRPTACKVNDNLYVVGYRSGIFPYTGTTAFINATIFGVSVLNSNTGTDINRITSLEYLQVGGQDLIAMDVVAESSGYNTFYLRKVNFNNYEFEGGYLFNPQLIDGTFYGSGGSAKLLKISDDELIYVARRGVSNTLNAWKIQCFSDADFDTTTRVTLSPGNLGVPFELFEISDNKFVVGYRISNDSYISWLDTSTGISQIDSLKLTNQDLGLSQYEYGKAILRYNSSQIVFFYDFLQQPTGGTPFEGKSIAKLYDLKNGAITEYESDFYFSDTDSANETYYNDADWSDDSIKIGPNLFLIIRKRVDNSIPSGRRLFDAVKVVSGFGGFLAWVF